LDGLTLYVIALFILIFISAFFSGSEAALFSLTRSRVSRLRNRSAMGRRVANLLARPRRLLITILIGNLLVNVFSTSAATSVAIRMFGDKGVGMTFLIMSALILIAGEIFPKVLAISRPRSFSLAVAFPLNVFQFLFTPVAWPLDRFSDTVIGFLKRRLGKATRQFSKEELITALDIGRKQGDLGKFEVDLFSNIIDFKETTVKEIMTPSINVFSLPIDMSLEGLFERVLASGYSRVPVYGETSDDIKGVLHIKDLSRVTEGDADFEIETILMPPYFVPESSRIPSLLSELGTRRAHAAIVIDEHGSFVGIATVEDILEELVGEIRDSDEPRTATHTLLEDGRIVVVGTMEIEEFNEVFGVNITDQDHETIAGYVVGALGEIPHAGETHKIKNLKFHIISAQPNRIRKMRVEKS
jgi:putative hemolysin